MAHPEVGGLELVGVSWEMSGLPAKLERAPLLGEHNSYVLGEVLGLGAEEIRQLRREDVIL